MEKGLEGNTQNITMFIFFISLLDCLTKSTYNFRKKKTDYQGEAEWLSRLSV